MRSNAESLSQACLSGSAPGERSPIRRKGRRTAFNPVTALSVSAMLASGCGGDNDAKTTSSAADLTATRSAREQAPALHGTWRTDPITIADMAATLREAGLAKSIRGFKRNAPISGTSTELVLEIRDGTWNLYGQPDGGAREEIDYDAQYELDGDTVVVSHEGDSNTYRWSINDAVLSLSWTGTTYEAYKGIPEEVFQRALYTTADFHRTP